MDLYSLPKDILVKLISTIREDTIQEYSKKIEELDIKLRLIREVSYNSIYPIELSYCSFPDCKSISASNYRDKDAFHNCEDMVFCDLCADTFCDKHLNDGVCSDCLEEN